MSYFLRSKDSLNFNRFFFYKYVFFFDITLTANNGRKVMFFPKIYDISKFLNFLYLPQTVHLIFFHFNPFENILILFYYFLHTRWDKKNWYNVANFCFFNIKLINPI